MEGKAAQNSATAKALAVCTARIDDDQKSLGTLAKSQTLKQAKNSCRQCLVSKPSPSPEEPSQADTRKCPSKFLPRAAFRGRG
jgi:hypothetical protein